MTSTQQNSIILRTHMLTGANHRRYIVGGLAQFLVPIPLAPRTARAIDLAIGERCAGPIFLTTGGARLDRHATYIVAAYVAGAAR
jgi:hypothetical protein